MRSLCYLPAHTNEQGNVNCLGVSACILYNVYKVCVQFFFVIQRNRDFIHSYKLLENKWGQY